MSNTNSAVIVQSPATVAHGSDTAFIVRFRATPRGMDRSWIRYAPDRASAVESALAALREEFGAKGRLLACDRVTMAPAVSR